MRLRDVRAGDERELLDVAAPPRWGLRRGLSALAEGLDPELQRDAVREAVAAAGAVVAESEGRAVGVASCSARPWETEQLEVEVETVSLVLGDRRPGERASAAADLLASLRPAGAERLQILKVDADDDGALVGAQRAGFTLHETTLAYLNDAGDGDLDHVPTDCDVSAHPTHDLPDFSDDEVERLLRSASRFMTTHYGADLRLSRSAVGGLYQEWVRKILSGEWVDRLVVARRGGELLGIVSLKFDRDVERLAGTPLLVGSFVISTASGTHALRDMVRYISTRPELGSRYCEFVTTARNVASNRGLQERPTMRLVRAGHTLHRWGTA